MNEALVSTFHRLIQATTLDSYRYLYRQFNLNNRLTGIVGPRGVGKTTLMLQHLKAHLYNAGKAFYFSADHLYFNTHSLYAFLETLYQHEGIEIIFIDEIHQYPNWSQELKNLYDAFPKMTIVFSGSSVLDVVKGGYDLSRRAHLLHLQGLSFREYLNRELGTHFQALPLQKILADQTIGVEYQEVPKLLGHFKDYLSMGYYPLAKEAIFEIGGKNKSTRQIQDAPLPAYIVKDDILVRTGRSLPLYVFGFLY